MELRQLLEVTELALEATGRPLRVLVGDTARSERRSPPGRGLDGNWSIGPRLRVLLRLL